jgi:N-acyl-L-homoserine lactone synthetase
MLCYSENGYLVKQLDDKEISQSQKFRYEIVVKELGWVKSDSGLEVDRYDKAANCFGIFKDDDLIGFTRLVPYTEASFMTFNEFGQLVKDKPDVDLNKAADISRLIVSSKYRGIKDYFDIVKSLYRIMYLWSVENNIRYWFFVSYKKELSALKKFHHMPIKTLGSGKCYLDNEPAYACFLDLVEAEKNLEKVSPEEFAWYTKDFQYCFNKHQ